MWKYTATFLTSTPLYLSMNDLTPFELARLADYFARELDPVETHQVELWIAASPSRSRFVKDMLQSRFSSVDMNGIVRAPIAARLHTLRSSLATIRKWDRFDVPSSVCPSNKDENITVTKSRFISSNWRAVSGMMAAITLFVVMGWYATSRGASAATSSTLPISTYATGPGERATITLPDGSSILLNVASRIDIPMDYARGSRKVILDGAALFTVKANSNAPFTVVARNTATRVLGTTFMVRRYASDSATLIAVRDGKVATESAVLTAGEAVFEDGLNQSVVHPAKEQYFGFVKHELTLEDVPLPSAIKELNRWYNTDIRMGDASLTHRRITGVFESGSLTDLVSILKLAFDIRVVRDGQVLTLYRGI